jgi:bifunctional non-homologous end joining protein LigD
VLTNLDHLIRPGFALALASLEPFDQQLDDSETNLARRRAQGIFVAPFEQSEIGPNLFRHACLMGLEGLVSKHRDSPYRGGRFRHWIKGEEPGAASL